MDFITLNEAIHAIAAHIGLPEFIGNEVRTFERSGKVVEFEEQYLYACRYSFSAAVLHQCITNSTAPMRWWSMHPDTGMAVISDSGGKEGLAILARFARLIRHEQDISSNHFLVGYGLPSHKPRMIELTEFHEGAKGIYEFQTVGLVVSELVWLLTENKIVHSLRSLSFDAEQGPATESTPTGKSLPMQIANPLAHIIEGRAPAILTTEINHAKANTSAPDDAASVWNELTKLAESKFGVMIGFSSDGIQYRGRQYQATQEPDVFTRRNLRERMTRAAAKRCV